jgi:hypothetical protein
VAPIEGGTTRGYFLAGGTSMPPIIEPWPGQITFELVRVEDGDPDRIAHYRRVSG